MLGTQKGTLLQRTTPMNLAMDFSLYGSEDRPHGVDRV